MFDWTEVPTFFDFLARRTWDTIGDAHRRSFQFGEDAITSANILALANCSFPGIKIQDTRVDEAQKGCDIEFWIKKPRTAWRRYAVQAKKISAKTRRFDKLDYITGGRSQVSVLREYAAANGALPIYCLYNYVDPAPDPPSEASRSCQVTFTHKDLGCTVTPCKVVETALKKEGTRNFKKNFRWLHEQRETLPWSCLVRCCIANGVWNSEVTGYENDFNAHDRLPDEVACLLEPSNFEFEDPRRVLPPDAQDESRPRWVAVIDCEFPA